MRIKLIEAVRSRPLLVSGCALFLLAFSLRFTYVATTTFHAPIVADAATYVRIAINLVEHGVYTNQQSAELNPTAYVTPGYPMFLAAVIALTPNLEAAYWTGLFIQTFLSAITVVFLFLIGLRLLPFWAAATAGILATFSPHLVVASGYLLTETLFTFLLVASVLSGVVAFERKGLVRFLFFGLLLGLASLVRPALLLFVIPVLGLILLRVPVHSRARACGVILIGVLIFWIPWIGWKHLYTSDERSLAVVGFAHGMYPNLVFEKRKGYPELEDPHFETITKSFGGALSVLFERAKNDPWKYIGWYAIGKPSTFWSWSIVVGAGGAFIYPVTSMYQRNRLAFLSIQLSKLGHPVLVVGAFMTIAMVLVCTFRECDVPSGGSASDLLALLVIYFTVVHMVFSPLPRYSIPLHGPLYLLALQGMVTSSYLVREKLKRRN